MAVVDRRETLGSALRSARLGFRWSGLLRCYMRVSGEPGRWLVELAAPKALPTRETASWHKCWWEAADIEPMLAEAVTRQAGNGARAVPKADRLLKVTVDDGGRVLQVANGG